MARALGSVASDVVDDDDDNDDDDDESEVKVPAFEVLSGAEAPLPAPCCAPSPPALLLPPAPPVPPVPGGGGGGGGGWPEEAGGNGFSSLSALTRLSISAMTCLNARLMPAPHHAPTPEWWTWAWPLDRVLQPHPSPLPLPSALAPPLSLQEQQECGHVLAMDRTSVT